MAQPSPVQSATTSGTGGAIIPRLFAAFALIIGLGSGLLHYLVFYVLQQFDILIAPLRQRTSEVPGIHAAWHLVEGTLSDLGTVMLAKTAAAAVLVVVSFGIWFRLWWARRALLIWCVLVGATLAFDFTVVSKIEDGIRSGEQAALQEVAGFVSSKVASHSESGVVADVIGRATQVGGSYILEGSNLHMCAAMDSSLTSYVLIIFWFPAILAIAFGRRSAAGYFRSRPGK